MKKSIKEIRAQEVATKTAEEAKAARQAELDAIEEKDAFSTIPAVRDGSIASVSDENENLMGIEGGKYHTTLVGDKVISAETKEELEAIKTRMANGIEGDGMLHKTVTILGMKCDIQGRTEEELEADFKAAEEAAYAHRNHMFRDVTEAEALHADEYTENDGKQVEVRGRVCLILFNESRVISTVSHETLIDLADKEQLGADAAKLSKETIERLIIEKLDKRFLEEDLANEEAEDGYDEGYEDGHDEGYEDGYDEGYKDGHDEGYEDGYEDGLDY